MYVPWAAPTTIEAPGASHQRRYRPGLRAPPRRRFAPSGQVSLRSVPFRPVHPGQRPAGEWALGTRKEPEDQRAPYLLDPLQSHPLPAAGDQAASGPGRPEAARCRLRRRAAPLGERPPARARRGALWAGVRRRGSERRGPEARMLPGGGAPGQQRARSLARGPARLPGASPAAASGSQPRCERVCKNSTSVWASGLHRLSPRHGMAAGQRRRDELQLSQSVRAVCF